MFLDGPDLIQMYISAWRGQPVHRICSGLHVSWSCVRLICVVEHVCTDFCLGDISQKLPRQQFTLSRAGGRQFATLLVSEALVIQLLKFCKLYTGRKNVFSLFN